MLTLGAFLFGVIVGGVGVWVFLRQQKPKSLPMNKRRQEKKEAAKQKILDLFQSKKHITNNDVEKLLDISDATATRYFQELEEEGKIKQVGKEGRYVYYEPV